MVASRPPRSRAATTSPETATTPPATTARRTPAPDPDPLDCGPADGGDGHGTHVAGTAAGDGVLADGSTYTGPYNASTISGHSWKVGPGVAPQATLYSSRCSAAQGSTDLTVDAINRGRRGARRRHQHVPRLPARRAQPGRSVVGRERQRGQGRRRRRRLGRQLRPQRLRPRLTGRGDRGHLGRGARRPADLPGRDRAGRRRRTSRPST